MTLQRAILIGVDRYGSEGDPLPSLTASIADALAMRDTLLRLGAFAADEITLLTDPPRPNAPAATRGAILEALLGIYERPEPLDRLLVFFSGHGLSLTLGRGAGHLATALVCGGCERILNRGDHMIDLGELTGLLSRRGAQEQTWIIDACRSLPPEGKRVEVSTIGWSPPDNAADQAETMAQDVLFAVAPLAMARAEKNANGWLTASLLRGLGGEGLAAVYDEAADDLSDDTTAPYCITIDSLAEHAAALIRPRLGGGGWVADLLPRVQPLTERRTGPLLRLGRRPKTRVGLRTDPASAARAVNVTLVHGGIRVAAWPPMGAGELSAPLPARPYRVAASVGTGWALRETPPRVIDTRITPELVLALHDVPSPQQRQQDLQRQLQQQEQRSDPREQRQQQIQQHIDPFERRQSQQQQSGWSHDQQGGGQRRQQRQQQDDPQQHQQQSDRQQQQRQDRQNDDNQPPQRQQREPPEIDPARAGAATGAEVAPMLLHPAPLSPAATPDKAEIAISAFEPGATAWLVPPQGGQATELPIGPPTLIAPGFWRIDLRLGQTVIATTEDDFARGQAYLVEALAQVTPATAALLAFNRTPPGNPRSVTPSESIGPMQGAILPTLLPLLAAKLFDTEGTLLPALVLQLQQRLEAGPAPLAVAVAVDGAWNDARIPRWMQGAVKVTCGGAPVPKVWHLALGRVALHAHPSATGSATVTAEGMGTLSFALPSLEHCVASVGVVLLPGGRWEVTVACNRKPLRKAAVAARVMALAARLGAAAFTRLDAHETAELARENPVLGALGVFALRGGPGTGHGLGPDALIATLAQTLLAESRALPDTLVIGAIRHTIDPAEALAIAADAQPVLADSVRALAMLARHHDQPDHWAIARAQRLAPDAVFNAIVTPPQS